MKKEVLLGGNARYGDAQRFSNTSYIIVRSAHTIGGKYSSDIRQF